MNILFLSIGRLNNINDYGLYTDLLRQFRDNEHQVYIMTSSQKRLHENTRMEQQDGVKVLRIKVGNLTKTNLIEKGLSTIMLERQFLAAYKKYLDDVSFDLVIYATPPITFFNVIKYIKKCNIKAKTYLLLKDIFPQNAVDLELFKGNSLLYRYFRRKEKKLYGISDYIGCMSKANVNFVINNNDYINPDIVEVCPNSIDPRKMVIEANEKIRLRNKYGIPINETIFVYGGSLGKPQGIDFLIEVLKHNETNKVAFILIIGSGTEFTKIKQSFDKHQFKNSLLLSSLPKDEYDTLVYSCDVGLIFLDPRFTIPNFPSRFLSYAQAGLPMLAATDTNTDIGEIIAENEFGYWSENGDLQAFFENAHKLAEADTRKAMGIRAQNYLLKYHTAQKSYDIIMKHFV